MRPERQPRIVRPYLLTGGRSTTRHAAIELEAQVVSTDLGVAALPALRLERHDIVSLCRTPLALAELTAHLGLHVGVVRVLVGDLLGQGHVSVRRPYVGAHRDLAIIERVMRGLQAIG